MMGIPRRTFSELVTLHELEPNLVDVFVEGALDQDVLCWYFKWRKLRHVQVYTVDTLDVDALSTVPVLGGNRGRLFLLALNTAQQIPAAGICCVCDRDFEDWLPTLSQLPQTLFLTDFASMEGYFLDLPTLEKFTAIVLGESLSSSFLQKIIPTLQECFLIRLAHACLGWNLDWVTPERCCGFRGGNVTFRQSEFLDRLLQKNGQTSRRRELETAITRLRGSTPSDFRLCVHGHDLSGLIRWYFGKLGFASLPDEERILRSLMGCVENATLQERPLFRALEQRASRA